MPGMKIEREKDWVVKRPMPSKGWKVNVTPPGPVIRIWASEANVLMSREVRDPLRSRRPRV